MIEEFIDALAECYEAKDDFTSCKKCFGDDWPAQCWEYEQKHTDSVQKAEEIMRQVIRTELKVVSDE